MANGNRAGRLIPTFIALLSGSRKAFDDRRDSFHHRRTEGDVADAVPLRAATQAERAGMELTRNVLMDLADRLSKQLADAFRQTTSRLDDPQLPTPLVGWAATPVP